jgi:hypothetical protein
MNTLQKLSVYSAILLDITGPERARKEAEKYEAAKRKNDILWLYNYGMFYKYLAHRVDPFWETEDHTWHNFSGIHVPHSIAKKHNDKQRLFTQKRIAQYFGVSTAYVNLLCRKNDLAIRKNDQKKIINPTTPNAKTLCDFGVLTDIDPDIASPTNPITIHAVYGYMHHPRSKGGPLEYQKYGGPFKKYNEVDLAIYEWPSENVTSMEDIRVPYGMSSTSFLQSLHDNIFRQRVDFLGAYRYLPEEAIV